MVAFQYKPAFVSSVADKLQPTNLLLETLTSTAECLCKEDKPVASSWCVLRTKSVKLLRETDIMRPEREADRSLHFVPRLRMGAAIHVLPHTTSLSKRERLYLH